MRISDWSSDVCSADLTLELLPSEAQDLVLAGALISIMLNPLIFRLLDRWQARQDASEQAQQARDADAALAEDAATHQVPDEVTDHAIVVGYGRVGNQLAALLKARGVPVVVVEGDADRVANAREAGFPAVRGNIASEKVMLDRKSTRLNSSH